MVIRAITLAWKNVRIAMIMHTILYRKGLNDFVSFMDLIEGKKIVTLVLLP